MEYAPTGRILVVDDLAANVSLLTRLMSRLGYEVISSTNGHDALEMTRSAKPDLLLLDVNMPGLDGFEVCRRLKSDPATRLIPIILITGLKETEDRIQGIESGADDFLIKPFVPAELEARARSLMRLKRYTDELESAESVILALATTIEARDPYTGGHCQRLANLARMFGMYLSFDDDQLVSLYRGGFLHDIGKIAVADSILLKPGPLTPDEFRSMQQHTVVGATLCGEFRSLRDVCDIVRHHHERVDGTGYPDRLAGDSIPLLAQVMSVVDAFDAMTTDRPYRAALTTAEACRELRREVERGWKQHQLVDTFVKLIESGAFAKST